MKEYLETPKRVVNIEGIKDLGGIRKSGSTIRIGALAAFHEIANSAAIRSEYPSIHEAVGASRDPQIRNMGTAGGDLCHGPVAGTSEPATDSLA